MKALRDYRERRYEMLVDVVYRRRGWTNDGVPTEDTLLRLGVDFPDVGDQSLIAAGHLIDRLGNVLDLIG